MFKYPLCSNIDLDVLQIIKNPISDHLPTGSRKIGTSFHSDKLVDIKTFATDKPIVFVVGSMAHGKVCFVFVVGSMAHGKVCFALV